MKALLHGNLVAESDDIVECSGYQYFPSSSVRMEWLEKARRTESDRSCPHGVQFYDVAEGAKLSPRAAWSYEAPKPAMSAVDHWIGFWRDVALE